MSSKLKGVARIELTNVKTGEKEVHVEHNMVTNAIYDIFAKNPYGCLDRTMMPADLMKGICLFSDTIEENASNIFLPAFPDAWAGVNTTVSSDNPKRGTWNTSESSVTETGAHFVWDWDTAHGNGSYASIALTSPQVCNGQFGQMVSSDESEKEWPLKGYSTECNTARDSLMNYDSAQSIAMYSPHYVDVKTGYQYGFHVKNANNLSTVVIGRCKRPVYSRYVNQSNYKGQGCIAFDYRETELDIGVDLTSSLSNNYVSVITSVSRYMDDFYFFTYSIKDSTQFKLTITKVNIDSIFSGNATMTQSVKTYSNVKPYGNSYTLDGATRVGTHLLPFEYPYAYVVGSGKLYAVNINDSTDVIEIPVSTASNHASPAYRSIKMGNFIYKQNAFLLDPVHKKAISAYESLPATSGYPATSINDGLFFLYTYQYVYCYLSPFYMATINNVTPFTKTSDQTMKITYDITVSTT